MWQQCSLIFQRHSTPSRIPSSCNHFQFKSYLTGKEQYVILDGVLSDPIGVISGTPQGSILGPLLFLDQLCSLDLLNFTSIQLYADDILLFRPLKTGDSTLSLQAKIWEKI